MPLKILLADDSMTAQSMGKKILVEAGYDVVAVSNGAAALKKIAETKPDIALLDVWMPGYSGIEVCEKIKANAETARIPVLLTVGKMEPFKVEEGIRAKADGVIVKPFEATDLLTVVGKLAELVQPPAAPAPAPVVEAPPLEEFEVPLAPPEQTGVGDAEIDLAKSPAMPLDIFEENAAPAVAAPPVVQLANAPAQAATVPPGSDAFAIDMKELEAAITQVMPAPQAPAVEAVPAMVSAVPEPAPAPPEPVASTPAEAVASQAAPAAPPRDEAHPAEPESRFVVGLASPEPEPEPTFVIELPLSTTETGAAVTLSAPATLAPAPHEAASAIASAPPQTAAPAVAAPVAPAVAETAEGPSFEITLEPVAEPAEPATEFKLEALDADESAALDMIGEPPAATPPAPVAIPASAPPPAPGVAVPEPQVEAAAEEPQLPTFEIRLDPGPAEPEVEFTSAPPSDATVEPEPMLEVITEERVEVSCATPPEPTLVRRDEVVDVEPDAALITNIHDFSAYVPSVAPKPPEELAGDQAAETQAVQTESAHTAEAPPTQDVAEEPAPPPDATITSDLPDAPAVVEAMAEQTRYPELAEESPEFALFGPDVHSEAETQFEARLSAALDAYDQAPEPPPERIAAPMASSSVADSYVSTESSQGTPSLEQSAEQVFAAAAASIAGAPKPATTSESVMSAGGAVNEPVVPATPTTAPPNAPAVAAQVAAASPALEKLITAIVDHVIERLKPEMLAELDRRRSELVAEITKELKD